MSDTRDRPADEVEVTEAMREAGASVLIGFNTDYETWEEGAENVFRAMFAARVCEGKEHAGDRRRRI